VIDEVREREREMSVDGIIASPWFLFIFLGVLTVLISIVG
jgi:hypothetical protein